MATGYATEVEPIAVGGQRRFRYPKPGNRDWSDIGYDFRPIAGQPISIRETMLLTFRRNSLTDDNIVWLDRFQNEAFIGHYQVSRLVGSNSGDATTVYKSGQIIGVSENTEFFTWSFSLEYNLNLYLNKTDKNAAYLSAIKNCNADLRPGAVPNTFIDTTNVSTYVEIAYGIATGDLANAASLIDSLTSPTTAGYRFGDEILFQGINNIPGISLEDAIFTPRIGTIGVWLHPDYSPYGTAIFAMQVANYSILARTIDQFPDGTTCAYPGSVPFPP